MCGIVGVLNLDPERPADVNLVRRMMDALAHRGPDEDGIFTDGPVALGHKRLSILDLASGQQPMTDGPSRHTIVYNGEIYNYRGLRAAADPGRRGFRTNCDTEVLLRLATQDGFDWLHSLNGMFAFAVWDSAGRRLRLARDRFGIKPLYTMVVDDQFVFSSEIKPLLLHPSCDRSVDPDALGEYMYFRRVNEPRTLFPAIAAFPPGHRLEVRCGERPSSPLRWWSDGVDDAVEGSGTAAEDLEATFEHMLDEAVQSRLVSDVPLGTYNSGGVDSSLTTAAVRRRTDGELHTFSVGFQESSHDESRYAQIVADRIGTRHHKLVIDQRQYADTFCETLRFNEEPLHHAHSVQLLLLSRYAKQFVTVVLTGEGADEGFGGYPRYQIPLLVHRFRRFPRPLVKFAYGIVRSAGLRRAAKLLQSGGDLRRSIIENTVFVDRDVLDDLLPDKPAVPSREDLYDAVRGLPLSLLEQVLVYDRGSYMLSLLHRLDRMTMASGVEARVPYLDHRLVAWSRSLPSAMKITPGKENKVLLKRVAARTFPHEMVYRRKMGFDVPIGPWLASQGPFARYLDCLTDDTFRRRGLFPAAKVARLVDDHRQGRRDHADSLWELINVEMWMRTVVDA